MKISLKLSRLEIRRTKVKWIILHHTEDEYHGASASIIDNSKYQMNPIMNVVLERNDPDINYHFIIDKIKDEYMVFTCRPFVTLCDYSDISVNTNNAAIHIGLMGSYDFTVPEKRLYEILAFRLLSPLLKLFILNPNRIKLHREVSNEKRTCPGDFFDKAVVISMVRKFVMK